MAGKKRTPAKSKKRPENEPRYEEFRFQGGRLVLDGRTIMMQTDYTPDQREEMIANTLSSRPQAESELLATVEQLEQALVVDPLHSLAVASIIYLLKDAETYRESEDDRSPAHVEFMALKALPFIARQSDVVDRGRRDDAQRGAVDETETVTESEIDLEAEFRAFETASTAIAHVRHAFDIAADLINLQFLDRTHDASADSGFEEFRRHALLQTLGIRQSAYPEHVEAILRGCLDPFDTECRRLLGFTAQEAWILTEAVHGLIADRIHKLQVGMVTDHREALAELARAKKKKRVPPAMEGLTPTQQKAWLRRIIEVRAFSGAVSLLSFSAADLGAEAGLDETIAHAWLNAFTCDPALYNERFHRLPCGAHPVTQRPVIATSAGYMVPAPTSLGEALRPLIEDKLRAAGRDVWGRYDHARAKWVERETAARLASALPGSVSWTGVDWNSLEDSSDLDGLVACDDFTARIQCKAGRISPAARRGAPSMAEDIQAVINDAAHQHARLATALADQTANEIGFSDDQTAALLAPLNVEVVVCLDDVTVWATETHKLRHLVALPDNPQTPWVLSLSDLMAVTDLLQGIELVHYITRRIRLESEGKVEAHDELDWVGHYIKDGLFFDYIFDNEHPPDVYRLLSYTEPIDEWYFARAGLLRRDVPRPCQDLPPQLRSFISKLERVRPTHWVLAGMLLLSGDQSSRQQVVDLMRHTESRARSVGWSNGTQIYPAHSLTLMADLRLAGQSLRRQARAYWSEKTSRYGRPNGVTLALGRDGAVVIDLVQSDPARTLAHDLFLRLPDPAYPDVDESEPRSELEPGFDA
jgi:hypothetical protein